MNAAVTSARASKAVVLAVGLVGVKIAPLTTVPGGKPVMFAPVAG